MKSNIKKSRVQVTYDHKSYPCFYDKSRDKTYYKVNKEFILIIDQEKIEEIKKSYFKERNKRFILSAIASIAAVSAVYALMQYKNFRKSKKKIQVDGRYKPYNSAINELSNNFSSEFTNYN